MLKVTKKQGFTLSLENMFLEKPQGEVVTPTPFPSFFRVNHQLIKWWIKEIIKTVSTFFNNFAGYFSKNLISDSENKWKKIASFRNFFKGSSI